ncbi:MAG: quinolinate synthase NadA [Paramuribaculum sp.]|nr:quinolinate synthase NadA [Paramuribaculum sp.]
MNIEKGYVDAPVDPALDLKEEILRLKKEKGVVILAHYYQEADIQDVADYIGDSLALAKIAATLKENLIVMCGVHFMGETVKILCPDKRVIVPDLNAGCSLADSCDAGEFESFVKDHPGYTVISYVNTSAAVKALTDIVVTSGNAKEIVASLPADEKIIFGPDRNLGNYISSVTGREMLVWDGACHVHEQFSVEKIADLMKQYPQAELLVHPECKKPLQLMAHKVGSTAALLDYTKKSPIRQFIVATESGILHQMQKDCPDKEFIPAPPADSTCACNECSYMKLITLRKLYNSLRFEQPLVEVAPELIDKARRPIEKMLELSARLGK